MSCYFLAHIEIHDEKEYQRYLNGYDQVFDKYKGRVLAVDDAPEVLEGDRSNFRTVLIHFPDKNEAHRWYDSEEYQHLVRHRHRASTSRVVLVEGRD